MSMTSCPQFPEFDGCFVWETWLSSMGSLTVVLQSGQWSFVRHFLKSLRKFPQCFGYPVGFGMTPSDSKILKISLLTHLTLTWTWTMRVHLVGPCAWFPHSFRSSSSAVLEKFFSLFDFQGMLQIVHSDFTCLSDVFSSDTYGLWDQLCLLPHDEEQYTGSA